MGNLEKDEIELYEEEWIRGLSSKFPKDIKRSNYLIQSKHTFTLIENKILLLAYSKLKAINDSEYIAVITPDDVRDVVPNATNNLYRELKKAANNLFDTKIIAKDPKDDERYFSVHLVNRSLYDHGTITIVFSKIIKDYLTAGKNYTVMKQAILYSFTKSYSLELYQLLKVQEYCMRNGYVDIKYDLLELRLDIGCINIKEKKRVQDKIQGKMDPDLRTIVEKGDIKMKYPRWGDFQKRILEPAVEEINKKSDLFVEYKPQTSGRGGQVRSVVFRVSSKKNRFIPDIKVQEIMNYAKLNAKDATTLLDLANGDVARVEEVYDMMLRARERTHIYSPIAWMCDAIKHNYADKEEMTFQEDVEEKACELMDILGIVESGRTIEADSPIEEIPYDLSHDKVWMFDDTNNEEQEPQPELETQWKFIESEEKQPEMQKAQHIDPLPQSEPTVSPLQAMAWKKIKKEPEFQTFLQENGMSEDTYEYTFPGNDGIQIYLDWKKKRT